MNAVGLAVLVTAPVRRLLLLALSALAVAGEALGEPVRLEEPLLGVELAPRLGRDDEEHVGQRLDDNLPIVPQPLALPQREPPHDEDGEDLRPRGEHHFTVGGT